MQERLSRFYEKGFIQEIISCIVCSTELDSWPSWDYIHMCGPGIILRSHAGHISFRTACQDSLGTRLMVRPRVAREGTGAIKVQEQNVLHKCNFYLNLLKSCPVHQQIWTRDNSCIAIMNCIKILINTWFLLDTISCLNSTKFIIKYLWVSCTEVLALWCFSLVTVARCLKCWARRTCNLPLVL